MLNDHAKQIVDLCNCRFDSLEDKLSYLENEILIYAKMQAFYLVSVIARSACILKERS